jgi:hypothetical protein
MTSGAKVIVGLAEAVESLHAELMRTVEAGKGNNGPVSSDGVQFPERGRGWRSRWRHLRLM